MSGEALATGAPRRTRRLENLPGVLRVLAGPITEHAVVQFDSRITTLEEIFLAVECHLPGVGRAIVRWNFTESGVTCAACARRVEETLRALPGVCGVTANADLSKVTVEYTPALTDASKLRDALNGVFGGSPPA